MSPNLTDSVRVKRNLQLTFDLHEVGVSMMEQNLRRRHPEATEVQLKEMLRAWLQDRPLLGVPFEQLDKPGRTVP